MPGTIVHGILTLPASVTVPEGQTNISFSVPTAVVTTQTGLTVFATAGGLQQLAPLFVNPVAPQTFVLTVNATGRNGETVTSSPANVTLTQHEKLRRYEFGLEAQSGPPALSRWLGGSTLSSLLVTAHELSPSGQN
jgi:hypothetical protein